MIVKASVKNLRISEKKVRFILKCIRHLYVMNAISILSFSTKKASFFIKKLLYSVISNAEHNNGFDVATSASSHDGATKTSSSAFVSWKKT